MDITEAFASAQNTDVFSAPSIVAHKYFERAYGRVLARLPEKERDEFEVAMSVGEGSPVVDWRPEIGMALSACDAGKIMLAAFQLLVTRASTQVRFSGNLEKSSLFVDGWLIQVEGATSVLSGGGLLQVRSALGEVNFLDIGNWWELVGASADSGWIVYRSAVSRPRYIVRSDIPGSSKMFPAIGKSAGLQALSDRSPCNEMASGATKAINAALIGIERSGNYGGWLATAVDGIILTGGDVPVGISSPNFPGLIALNDQGSVLDYAETIVSAVCHQKLFQLAMIHALTEPGKEEVHYVPERRSYTTTRRALAAAHEHINAICMLNGFQDPSVPSELIDIRIRKRELMLMVDCVSPLEKSEILTPAGKHLWQHLKSLSGKDGESERPIQALSYGPTERTQREVA